MRKEIRMAFVYNALCLECNSSIKVYFTVSDFGDAPIIKKCSHCGELYWYTPEDEAYIQPIDKQLIGIKCVKCNESLLNTLIHTYKNIQCCDIKFSLDDDFFGFKIPPVTELEQIDVYLIYS